MKTEKTALRDVIRAADSLIFDLDGTLWDTTATCAIAWNSALNHFEPRYPKLTGRNIADIAGLTRSELLHALFPDLSHPVREKIADAALACEVETIRREGARLYPGVADGLRKLAEHFPLYLVSNCNPDYAELFFDLFDVREFFRDFETHGNTGSPKAENLALLVKRNHLRAPIYVGDTDVDEDACLQNGIPFVHVNYGFGGAQPAHFCASCDSFSELVDEVLGAR